MGRFGPVFDNVAQIDPDADLGCTGNPRPRQSSRHLALDLDDSAVMVLTLSSKLPKGIKITEGHRRADPQALRTARDFAYP
jgi:hypothetical protein